MKRAIALTAIIGLAACSGHGSGSVVPSPAGAKSGAIPLTFKISIPLAHPSKTLHVSAATDGVGVTTYAHSDSGHATPIGYFGNDVSATSPQCATVNYNRVCSISAAAPAGDDDLVVSTYDAVPDGSGGFPSANMLDTGVTHITIVQGQDNSVNVTLGGIPAVLELSVDNPNVYYNAHLYGAMPYNVEVTALDATGASIIGSDPYANPITLSPSEGAVTVNGSASTTVTAPTDLVTIVDTPTVASHFSTLAATASGATSATASYTVEQLGATFPFTTNAGPTALASGTTGDMYYGDAAQEIVRYDVLPGDDVPLTYGGMVTPDALPVQAIVRNPTSVSPNVGADVSWVTGFDGTEVWVGNTDGSGATFNPSPLMVSGTCMGIANGAITGDRYVACGNAVVDTDSGQTSLSLLDGVGGIISGPDNLLWYVAYSNSTTNVELEKISEAGLGTDTPSLVASLGTTVDAAAPMPIVTCPDTNVYVSHDSTTAPLHVLDALHENGLQFESLYLSATATAMACGPDGSIWIGESSGVIERFDPVAENVITAATLGGAIGGIALGPDGAMWATVTSTDQLVRITP